MASPTSIEGINRLLASRAVSNPREAIRLREQLLKAGVKGTSLHLGAVTPEVEAQLNASKKQQKFTTKADQIQQGLDLAVATQGRGIGNTSGAEGQARSKAVAEQTFRIQQAFTKAKSQQVQEAYQSPEFQILKATGDQTGFSFADILNLKGVAVPKHQTLIVNELAQAPIQGDISTANNINRILEQSGFTNKVTVKNGVLSGLESNPFLAESQNQVNQVISGSGSILDSVGFPTSDIRFSDLPELAQQEAEIAQGSGLLGFLTNPFVIAGIVGTIGLAFLLKGR